MAAPARPHPSCAHSTRGTRVRRPCVARRAPHPPPPAPPPSVVRNSVHPWLNATVTTLRVNAKVDADVPLDENPRRGRQIPIFGPRPGHDLAGHVLRGVARPAFLDVENDDPQRAVILSGQEIFHDR